MLFGTDEQFARANDALAKGGMAAEAAAPIPLEAGESLVTTTVSGQIEVAD